jgi:hypothetical protein
MLGVVLEMAWKEREGLDLAEEEELDEEGLEQLLAFDDGEQKWPLRVVELA